MGDRNRALLPKPKGKPYVVLRRESLRLKVCANCSAQRLFMRKCAGCKIAYYCCSRCQRTHWALHKLYCNSGTCLPLLNDLLAPIPEEVRADEYHELESRAKLVPNPFLREVRSRALVSKITRQPYVPLRNGTLDPKVCANCLLQQLSMKKCAGCKTVYYCCIRCQRTHWALHRVSCNPDFCLPLGTNGILYEVNPHVDPQPSGSASIDSSRAGRVASRSASNISVGSDRSYHLGSRFLEACDRQERQRAEAGFSHE